LARCYQRGDLHVFSGFTEDNGSLGRGKGFFFLLSQKYELFGLLQVRYHKGKRLILPSLVTAEPFQYQGVSGIAGEMEPPEALDGGESPLLESLYRRAESCFVQKSNPLFVGSVEGRAAFRTCHRLGMIPSVFGILILLAAERTERKDIHTGIEAIIGKIPDDGKPRAAVGAICEGITVPGIFRSLHILHAICTDSNIRRNKALSPVFRFA
jgi:hypothetical protein